MKKADLRWIRNISTVDVRKVGNLIDEGMHHRVYEYGHDEVIKIPRRRFNFLYSKRSNLESDILLIQTYFPGLAIRTVIHSSADQNQHCMVQEKVKKFRSLDQDSIHNVKSDFNKLLLKNQQLRIKHNCSLDLLGGHGVMSCIGHFFGGKKKPYFSNTVLMNKKGGLVLRLIDTELLRLSLTSYTFIGVLSWIFSYSSLLSTRLCLRYIGIR